MTMFFLLQPLLIFATTGEAPSWEQKLFLSVSAIFVATDTRKSFHRHIFLIRCKLHPAVRFPRRRRVFCLPVSCVDVRRRRADKRRDGTCKRETAWGDEQAWRRGRRRGPRPATRTAGEGRDPRQGRTARTTSIGRVPRQDEGIDKMQGGRSYGREYAVHRTVTIHEIVRLWAEFGPARRSLVPP